MRVALRHPWSRHIYLGLCPCFSTNETANFKHKRTSDEGSRPMGVNCSCFSLCEALGGAC